MAKDFAKSFYRSKRWQHTRNAYGASVGWLCERCLKRGIIKPGDIVHHKVHIDTEDKLNDPTIALSFNNLELVCRECHAELHKDDKPSSKRYKVDEYGRVTAR